jgi:hypothetical protein
MMVGMLVTLLAIAAVAPGQTVRQQTPAPVMMAPAPAMGYYLMVGNTIVSQPFAANVSDCFKMLAKIKSTMQPGTNNLVCVHRHP